MFGSDGVDKQPTNFNPQFNLPADRCGLRSDQNFFRLQDDGSLSFILRVFG
jgi:hypothetical protein